MRTEGNGERERNSNLGRDLAVEGDEGKGNEFHYEGFGNNGRKNGLFCYLVENLGVCIEKKI